MDRGAHPYQKKLVAIIDRIEDAELGVIELEDEEDQSKGVAFSRRNRLLANELKLRINRLTEEFEEIMKVLPLNDFIP